MNNRQQTLIQELKEFHSQLKEFRYSVEELDRTRMDTGSRKREREIIREELVRKSGKLKPIAVHLTGKQYGQQWNQSFDMWTAALGAGSSGTRQKMVSGGANG